MHEAAGLNGLDTSSCQPTDQFYLGLDGYTRFLVLQAISWADLDNAHMVVGYRGAWGDGEAPAASWT
jgi:hypothetical protein